MNKLQTKIKLNQKDELYGQYNWFYTHFLPSIQHAGDEFFSELFEFQLVSVSKNINILFQGDDYFVTKIRVDKQHDVFFRCSADGIKIILDRVLGETKKFDLSNITELEAKIISSFNDHLFNSISPVLLSPPPASIKRKNFDTINLTFFVRDKESSEGAKFIVSLPSVLLAPSPIIPKGESFDSSDFKTSKLDVKIKIGTTKFSLKDLKNLEKEDMVIFDNSSVNTMKLVYQDYTREFKINPNPGLMTQIDNDNGGNNMENNALSQSLWDNIQVEMGAEFETVKITLGELKNIEQGLVVDIASVYDNRISLKVENRTIAKGELVIVNDRYGVRIDEVFASEKVEVEQASPAAPISEFHEEGPSHHASQAPIEVESADEEFDYSDFELDDQDI